MIDDEQLLAPAPDVNYKDLPAQPSPQDFLVLTRVRGQMTVAQLCNTSGLGREKTLDAIKVLVDVGLLNLIGADGKPIKREPKAAPAPTPPPEPKPSPVARPVPEPEPEPVPIEPAYAIPQQEISDPFEDAIPMGAAASDAFEIERHPPAQAAPSHGIEIPIESTSFESTSFESSFQTAAPNDDDDDLFMPSSPAHIDRLEGRAPILRGEDLKESVAVRKAEPAAAKPSPSPAKPAVAAAAPVDADRYRLFPIKFMSYESKHPRAPTVDADAQREIDYVFDNLDYLDFYQLFGVTADADRKQIRAAYFTMSKQFHPDKFFGDDEGVAERVSVIFRFVTKGYETLSKPKKRSVYDEALQQARAAAEQGAADEDKKRAMAADMLERRAEQLEQQGEFAQAAGEMKKVGTLRRDSRALLRAANLYLRANQKLDEAAALARAAVKDLPTEVEPRLILGQIYEKNQMFAEALEVFTQAEGLAPGDPSVRVHLERIRAQV